MSYVVPIPSFNCTGRASLKRSPFRLSSKPPAPPTVRRRMPVITDENNLSEDIFFYIVRYISKDREERGTGRHGDKETTEPRSVGVAECWNAGSEIAPRRRSSTSLRTGSGRGVKVLEKKYFELCNPASLR